MRLLNRSAWLVALACTLGHSLSASADSVTPNNGLERISILPGADGRLGAWLIAGPFAAPSTGDPLAAQPPGIADDDLRPMANAPLGFARWRIASSADATIDVNATTGEKSKDAIAYAAITVRLDRPGKHYLLLGSDDGIRVRVDNRTVFARDDARPLREDEDAIPLDLTAGEHRIVLKLHQRQGAWTFRARLVDASFKAPMGAVVVLPGLVDDDARNLASQLAAVSLDRGIDGDAYRPKLTIKFASGVPLGVDPPLSVRLVPAKIDNGGSNPNAIVTATAFASAVPMIELRPGNIPAEYARGSSYVLRAMPIDGELLHSIDDKDWVYEVTLGARVITFPFAPRKAVRDAIAHASAVVESGNESRAAWLGEGSSESVLHLKQRLERYVNRGDSDTAMQLSEARELDSMSEQLAQGTDPYFARTGPMRRAYRSPIDQELSEFGVYVPRWYRPGTRRKFPLVIALHGMNGRPMAMLQWFFGKDAENRDSEWEDRHVAHLPDLDAFVIAPDGHGNSMYRDAGEVDVMNLVRWALRTYPIDPMRVTITGPSMGGIGTAAIAFRYPGQFAAAAPLCGYHSYFIRQDVAGHPLRPWERVLADERSNIAWAYNGSRIPLWIVHGTKDLPEANSGVLIDRYTELHYSVKHDHPDLGHNVWQPTYEDLKGAKWLLNHRQTEHPQNIRFRTMRPRYDGSAWLHIDELLSSEAWAEVNATIVDRKTIDVRSRGVRELHLDRDGQLLDPEKATTVRIDGTAITFDPSSPIALRRESDGWARADAAAGTNAATRGVRKRREMTGPIRDIFRQPLVFVYGTKEPEHAQINEEVARGWASVRRGMRLHYPVMSDQEFLAKGESLANDRSLFLVGNVRENQVLEALDPALPIHVAPDRILVGTKAVRVGTSLSGIGAAFIHPNPRRPDRYVVVVSGVDPLGTWRSLSLPELLPDYVVYDDRVAPAKGKMVLGSADVIAAGLFASDWSFGSETIAP